MVGVKWSRDELVIAYNLYCKTPFTKINSRNKLIQETAKFLGRTDSALAMKLANFARLDPALQSRNIAGMANGSKADKEIWDEFNGNWNDLAWASERALANISKQDVTDPFIEDDLCLQFPLGQERQTIIKARVNQSFFRKSVLASYNNRCCITSLSNPALLIASHIVPWSHREDTRTNPSNGICFSALYDKAFDAGLMTILPDYSIKFSSEILSSKDEAVHSLFCKLEGRKIILPQKFYPSEEFLAYHNVCVFRH